MEALRLYGAGNTQADIGRALGRSKSMVRLYLKPDAYQKHLEKCAARCRTPEYKEFKRKWYSEHREEWNAYQRKYREGRREKMRAYFAKYRIDKAGKLRVIRKRYEKNRKARLKAQKAASEAPVQAGSTAPGTGHAAPASA